MNGTYRSEEMEEVRSRMERWRKSGLKVEKLLGGKGEKGREVTEGEHD